MREMSTSKFLEKIIKFPTLQKSTLEKPVDKAIFSILPKGIMRQFPTFHHLELRHRSLFSPLVSWAFAVFLIEAFLYNYKFICKSSALGKMTF